VRAGARTGRRLDAEDALDDDGFGHGPLPIRVVLRVRGAAMEVDFTGTSPQVEGGVNAVAAITTSCVRYVTRAVVESLLGQPLPAGGGEMDAVRLVLPERSLVAAGPPASVAAGNVETSQRIADVLLLAFARALPEVVPAQSQGTMNNVAVGGSTRAAASRLHTTRPWQVAWERAPRAQDCRACTCT
jgi:N-methylhydantoinase B